MKTKWIIAIVIAGVLALCLLFVGIVYVDTSGSYNYAEIYQFDCNESELIAAIENLKKTNPQFIVPISRLPDGRHDSNDYWYHVYFYYPVEREIVHFWTTPANERGKTDVGFVSVSNGLSSGPWNGVNENFGREKNREVKQKFEQRILDRLGLKYKHNGNGMKFGFIQF